MSTVPRKQTLFLTLLQELTLLRELLLASPISPMTVISQENNDDEDATREVTSND